MEASSASLVATEDGYAPVFFTPRPLRNLVLVDELPSLMPLTDMKVCMHDSAHGTCIVILCACIAILCAATWR